FCLVVCFVWSVVYCWGYLGSYDWLLDMTLYPLVGVVATIYRFIFGGFTSSASSHCGVGLLELCCVLAPQLLYGLSSSSIPSSEFSGSLDAA
ncbi:hypothetical protein H0E87_018397, partial [Populus deltoides]